MDSGVPRSALLRGATVDKILLVEDNPGIYQSLITNLELSGFSVVHAATLKEAAIQLSKSVPGLLILDINLPDGNGLDFCRETQAKHPLLPVIMLTAKTDEKTAVESLANGAVDFVRKPFGTTELIARVKRALDRQVKDAQILSFGLLKMNLTERTVQFDRKAMKLSKREFDVLALFVKRGNGIVSRDEILTKVDEDCEIMDRTIDSYISHLRAKLKKAGGEKIKIAAVYGAGYRLEEK